MVTRSTVIELSLFSILNWYIFHYYMHKEIRISYQTLINSVVKTVYLCKNWSAEIATVNHVIYHPLRSSVNQIAAFVICTTWRFRINIVSLSRFFVMFINIVQIVNYSHLLGMGTLMLVHWWILMESWHSLIAIIFQCHFLSLCPLVV